jgi:hypothetical protein
MNENVPFEIHKYDTNGKLKKTIIITSKNKVKSKPNLNSQAKQSTFSSCIQNRVSNFFEDSYSAYDIRHTHTQVTYAHKYQKAKKHHEETNYPANHNSSLWKNLTIAALLTGITFGSYFLINKSYNASRKIAETEQTVQNKVQSTSKITAKSALQKKTKPHHQINYIASANYNDTLYKFTANDKFMIKLSKQTAYFNLQELSVEKELFNLTLNITNQLSLSEIIRTANLYGTHQLYTGYSKGELNFTSALNNLWKMKAIKFEHSYNEALAKKTNLFDLETKIKNELGDILLNFNYDSFYKKQSDPKKASEAKEKQRFYKNYFSHLNENILIAYGITELFPKETNPVLNAVFLDKMLRKVGVDFLNKIPSLNDRYLSFGFFQLTSKIITPLGAPSLNEFLPERLHIPASMKYFNSSEEHIRGAILVNIYNAQILANALSKENELSSFNNNFEKLTIEQQEGFVVGYISAAHHSSKNASDAVCEYERLVDNKRKSFENIISEIPLDKSVKAYYTTSLTNYLVLKEMNNARNELALNSK